MEISKLKSRFIDKDKIISTILKDLYIWLLNNKIDNVALSGGTALSKAYKIINRLSEDIDLIIFINKNNSKSKCKYIKKLIDTCFDNKKSYKILENDSYFKTESNYSNFEFEHLGHNFKVDIIIKDMCNIIDEIKMKDIVNVYDKSKVTEFPVVSLSNIFINKIFALNNKWELHPKYKTQERKRLVRHFYDIIKIIENVETTELNKWMKLYNSYKKISKESKENFWSNKEIFNNTLSISKNINNLLNHELLNSSKSELIENKVNENDIKNLIKTLAS